MYEDCFVYIFSSGGLSCIWTVVWFYQARDSPSEHPRISKAELRYLTNAIEFDTSRKVHAKQNSLFL